MFSYEGAVDVSVTDTLISKYNSGWVWFYGISTIVGYLMPNPVFIIYNIIYMICKHIL